MQPVVFQAARQGYKTNALNQRGGVGMRKHRLFDPVASLQATVREAVDRYAVIHPLESMLGIAALFRVKALTVADAQLHAGDGRLVGARKEDFGHNALVQGEPDGGLGAKRRAYRLLRAGSPVGRFAWISGRQSEIGTELAQDQSPATPAARAPAPAASKHCVRDRGPRRLSKSVIELSPVSTAGST